MALYFALKPLATKAKTDAAVYMIDPWLLNKFVYREMPMAPKMRPVGTALPSWDEAKPYLLEDEFESDLLGPRPPLAIDPSHVARRFSAQRSRFVIFGRQRDGLTGLAEKKHKTGKAEFRLCRIRVKRSSVEAMRRELETCGISESTIFPDMEGFGRELNGIFVERWMRGAPRKKLALPIPTPLEKTTNLKSN